MEGTESQFRARRLALIAAGFSAFRIVSQHDDLPCWVSRGKALTYIGGEVHYVLFFNMNSVVLFSMLC